MEDIIWEGRSEREFISSARFQDLKFFNGIILCFILTLLIPHTLLDIFLIFFLIIVLILGDRMIIMNLQEKIKNFPAKYLITNTRIIIQNYDECISAPTYSKINYHSFFFDKINQLISIEIKSLKKFIIRRKGKNWNIYFFLKEQSKKESPLLIFKRISNYSEIEQILTKKQWIFLKKDLI